MSRGALLAIGLVGILTALTWPGSAQAQDIISCEGTEGGGQGPRNYTYWVTNNEPVGLTHFVVGTDDLNAANYANWLMIPGWQVAIVPGQSPWGPIWENQGIRTNHGVVAPLPSGLGAGVIHWWDPTGVNPIPIGAQLVTFGFDNPNLAQNVDWYTSPNGNFLPGANWLQPVAGPRFPNPISGTGPVHGPTPEPATLSLLGLGAIALLRRKAS